MLRGRIYRLCKDTEDSDGEAETRKQNKMTSEMTAEKPELCMVEAVATSLVAEQIKASRIRVHVVLTIHNEKTVMVTKLHCHVRCCDI